ncbi:MAG: hypothetical protein NC223_05235, partial [Butyrivibrio sp.]|nr:hypothetical protein [Butyrivibrio sp.]
DKIEGELSAESEEFILREGERLETVLAMQEEYEKMYQNGEITLEEVMAKNDEYLYAKAQKPAFDAIYAKYEYFLSVGGGSFFYDLDTDELRIHMSYDVVFILTLCFVLMLSYDMEYRGGIDMMIKTMPLGRRSFRLYKVTGALTVSALTAAVWYISDIAVYAYRYSFEHWNEGIYNIGTFARVICDMPIWAYFLLVFGLKLLISCMLSAFISLVSSVFKKRFIILLVSAAVLYVPIILKAYMPLWLNRIFSPTLMADKNIAVSIIICAAVTLILSALSVFAQSEHGKSF